jgi:poly(3-hydroxybutyrate) depolymerase
MRKGEAGRAALSLLLASATHLLLSSASASAQTPGPQVLTFFSSVDDSDQPYALYLPRHYDPSRAWPLVVSLHGADSNHRLNLRRVFGRGNAPGETDSQATRYFPRFPDVDFLVASPLARGTMGYQGIPEQDVYDMLADVQRRFRIDENRIYLTGLSMGGGGALWLGLTRPDLWAAVAPVCPSTREGAVELAPNALHLPVRLFHGDHDPSVPVAGTRQWHKRLLELGGVAEYIEYPGVRHNAWDLAYRDAAIFEWFARHRRDPRPARVRFVTRAYRYRSAYWVEMDALTPGELAEIDVRWTGPNRLEARTKNLDGFTLRLTGHPQFTPRTPVEIAIDGVVLQARATESLSFVRAAPGWSEGRAAPAGRGAKGSTTAGARAGSDAAPGAKASTTAGARAGSDAAPAAGSGATPPPATRAGRSAGSRTQTAGGPPSSAAATPAWRVGRAPVEGKRPGAEGPMREAVAGRHLYVYGTADSPAPEELTRRRETAEHAAAWSWSRTRLHVSFAVRADREVGPEDLATASLVLFGTRQTNSAIARFAPTPPLALNASAADYGLAYIYPAGSRYVLVNSGLPWWTGAEDAGRGGYARYAPHLRALTTFGDFILFRGSLADVVAEGRFDRNWKLPAAAAAAMTATGAVTIH